MILGQLWYGWAPKGAEGINQEQIVAGSGNLGSRASHVTQLVLPWCYYPKAESRGWVQSDGIGVAFRRTPTGRDARGRLGAFFVHALVWEAGTVPAALLAGLWDAAIWVTRPPDEPPEQLEPLRDEAELGRGEAPEPARETMVVTLAGLLENIAGSRLSALDLPPEQAYCVASRLAAALPAKFGLISFSTHEERDRADAYDLVAGPPPGPCHAPVGPGTEPPAEWIGAARLLLEAHEGDVRARTLVEALAEEAPSLPEFAERMRHLAEIDCQLAKSAGTPDPRSLGWLLKAPTVFAALLQGESVRGLARACIGEDRFDVLGAACRSNGEVRFVAALRHELAGVGPAEAISCLVRLAQRLPVRARELALALAESWQGESLRQLSPQEAVSLAQLLPVDDDSSTAAVVEQLTSAPALAGALAGAASLPVSWRANAAVAHPEEVSGQALVAAIAHEREFAQTFVRLSGQSGIEHLERAMEVAPMPLALACAEQASAYLASAEARVNLVWPAIQRLSPRERFAALNRYAFDIEYGEAWAVVAIEALVDAALDARDAGQALPRLEGPALNVRLRSTTDRIEAWRGLAMVVGAPGALQLEPAVRAVRQISLLADPREADAAIEVVVDAVCERTNRTREQWFTAMATVAWGVHEDDEAFALRLARAALRGGRGDRQAIVRWTVEWIADAIDRKAVSRGVEDAPVVVALVGRLGPLDIESIDDRVARLPRRSTSRGWLKGIVKTATKQSRHRQKRSRPKEQARL